MAKHSTHPDIVKRLKRANGHLNSIITMIEEGRPCVEVAQQMQAVYSAIGNAKQVFVQDHIQGCIEHDGKQTPKQMREQIEELKTITKYL